MTKLTTSVAAKVIAAVLLIACSFTCIGSIIGAAVMIDTWTGSNGHEYQLGRSVFRAERHAEEHSV